MKREIGKVGRGCETVESQDGDPLRNVLSPSDGELAPELHCSALGAPRDLHSHPAVMLSSRRAPCSIPLPDHMLSSNGLEPARPPFSTQSALRQILALLRGSPTLWDLEDLSSPSSPRCVTHQRVRRDGWLGNVFVAQVAEQANEETCGEQHCAGEGVGPCPICRRGREKVV